MKYTVPIGPIHPALKEPIAINCTVSGEEITDVDVIASQNHRGIEWIGMNRDNPIQTIYVAERICGICNFCHPACLAMAVEEIAEIEVPDRAQYIRVIQSELERIHSHLLWAGVAAHELGFDTLLHYTWMVREKVTYDVRPGSVLETPAGSAVVGKTAGPWKVMSAGGAPPPPQESPAAVTTRTQKSRAGFFIIGTSPAPGSAAPSNNEIPPRGKG